VCGAAARVVWLSTALVYSQSAAPSTPLMRTIAKGAQSNVDVAKTVTIRSAAEWAALWRTHAPERDLPDVDFSREIVAGVFLGSRPSAGFQVEVVGVRDEPDALVVQYRVTVPARDAVSAAVLTAPYHLVALPSRAGEVKFEKLQ
jgi:hypothetical protein